MKKDRWHCGHFAFYVGYRLSFALHPGCRETFGRGDDGVGDPRRAPSFIADFMIPLISHTPIELESVNSAEFVESTDSVDSTENMER